MRGVCTAGAACRTLVTGQQPLDTESGLHGNDVLGELQHQRLFARIGAALGRNAWNGLCEARTCHPCTYLAWHGLACRLQEVKRHYDPTDFFNNELVLTTTQSLT